MPDCSADLPPVYANFIILACSDSPGVRAFCVDIFTSDNIKDKNSQRSDAGYLRLAAHTKAKFPGMTKSGWRILLNKAQPPL